MLPNNDLIITYIKLFANIKSFWSTEKRKKHHSRMQKKRLETMFFQTFFLSRNVVDK